MEVTITRATRWPLMYALAAIPMIILAVDMMITHRFVPPPDTYEVAAVKTLEDGSTVDTTVLALTNDGKAQRRRELAWGAGLLAAGIAAAAWGLKDLLAPRRVLTMDGNRLTLRVERMSRSARQFAWEEVAEVRSGVIEDEGGSTPVLSLRFVDPQRVPDEPWGAVAEPPWLHLYSAEWDREAHEVAPMIETHLTRFRGPTDGS